MSFYIPDDAAVPRGQAFIALLSQRDLSIQVPINYVTLPGVSLTAACFSHGTYEDTKAARCFSNLLATGFRRFEVDIYWDVSRRLWSLCPVQLGNASAQFDTTTIATTLPPQTSMASLASGQLTGRQVSEAVATITTKPGLAKRQTSGSLGEDASGVTQSLTASASLPLVATTATLSADSSTTAVLAGSSGSTPSPSSASDQLLVAGPYSCTTTANFSLITTILSSYLQNTETDLNATTKYLILNLHAAVPSSDPTGSARQPAADSLPVGSNLLNSIISSNNSVYMYTPSELASQRADLNATGNWFAINRANQPAAEYFKVVYGSGHASSPNGWPSESYIELQKAKRLLAGFGTVDPQMRGYNFSADSAFIFPQGYLQATPDINLSSSGEVTGGCFYNANEHSVSAVNSSWATYDMSTTTPAQDILMAAGNITTCGISAILNQTLSNSSADVDIEPYQRYAYATNWAWAPGQPPSNRSTTSSNSSFTNTNDNNDTNSQNIRCAALNITSTSSFTAADDPNGRTLNPNDNGKWQATDCTASHFAACRVAHQPYEWRISDQRGVYARVDAGCPDNTSFSTPRTALENAYLTSTFAEFLSMRSDPDDTLLWVNFNSLSTPACWVIGQNSTCPYVGNSGTGDDGGRTIVVPTVAAVLVFVLAALTVFVKCAANRRSSKRRRRRGDDGWDYEGVPS